MHSASVRRSGRIASQSESPMLASENLPRLSPEGPSFASPGFCSPIVQQTQISECAALLTFCILVFPLKVVWRCVSDDPGRCSIIVTGSLNKRLCRRLPHFERPTAHRRKSIQLSIAWSYVRASSIVLHVNVNRRKSKTDIRGATRSHHSLHTVSLLHPRVLLRQRRSAACSVGKAVYGCLRGLWADRTTTPHETTRCCSGNDQPNLLTGRAFVELSACCAYRITALLVAKHSDMHRLDSGKFTSWEPKSNPAV